MEQHGIERQCAGMASMRPDLQRLCNADHRTAEEWLRNALESIGHELPGAGFAWTSNETRRCGIA